MVTELWLYKLKRVLEMEVKVSKQCDHAYYHRTIHLTVKAVHFMLCIFYHWFLK